jgi:hypothetical protein
MSTLEQQADEIMAYATGNGHKALYTFSRKALARNSVITKG